MGLWATTSSVCLSVCLYVCLCLSVVSRTYMSEASTETTESIENTWCDFDYIFTVDRRKFLKIAFTISRKMQFKIVCLRIDQKRAPFAQVASAWHTYSRPTRIYSTMAIQNWELSIKIFRSLGRRIFDRLQIACGWRFAQLCRGSFDEVTRVFIK